MKRWRRDTISILLEPRWFFILARNLFPNKILDSQCTLTFWCGQRDVIKQKRAGGGDRGLHLNEAQLHVKIKSLGVVSETLQRPGEYVKCK